MMVKLLCQLFFLLFLTGCTGLARETDKVKFYSGPQLSKNEIAVLRNDGQQNVIIESINGIRGQVGNSFNSTLNGAYWIELPPSDHEIIVRYWGVNNLSSTNINSSSINVPSNTIHNTATTVLHLTAKAGHEYTVANKKETNSNNSTTTVFYISDITATK